MSWSSTRRVEFRQGEKVLASVEASGYVQHWSEENYETIGSRVIDCALKKLGPAWVPKLLAQAALGTLTVRVDWTDIWLGPGHEPWSRFTAWDLGLEPAVKFKLLSEAQEGQGEGE